MKHATMFAGVVALLAGFALPAAAQPSLIAHTQIKDRQGKFVGYADFMETSGGLLVRLMVKDIEPGQHAVHIHAVGKCEPPSFESAGPHFNPDHRPHGILSGEGHAGDLPNVHVPDSGSVEVEMLTTRATLRTGQPNSLLDRDGSSMVIHAGSDDYRTDPAGDSGDRIACGVLTSESTVGGSTGK